MPLNVRTDIANVLRREFFDFLGSNLRFLQPASLSFFVLKSGVFFFFDKIKTTWLSGFQ